VKIISAFFAALAFLGSPSPVEAASCRPPVRVDQRTYQALEDRLFVYVGDIGSTKSRGWSPFTVRVLVGTYRRPFLSSKGTLNEASLDKLLAERRDIMQERLSVSGYEPKTSKKKTLGVPVTVKVDGRVISVRVTDVVPVGGGTDHLYVEVCG
jgi:hypothetical protein